MNNELDEILAANEAYVSDFDHTKTPQVPPARRLAILTCMDSRLDPAEFAGLSLGDAHILRNAGGRASDDAIRSLVISYKLLGTHVWLVIHHTQCGLSTITDEAMGDMLASSLETAVRDENGWRDVGKGPGSGEGRYVKWLTLTDSAQSVRDDVARIANNPMVPADISVIGLIYEVETGRLVPVPGASRQPLQDSRG